MDATEAFENLIQSIEGSKLNYSFSKTPFSASISLKQLFIKECKGSCSIGDVKTVEKMSRREVEQENKVRKLETENLELQKEIKNLKDLQESQYKELLDERIRLQEVFEQEKVKSKRKSGEESC